MWIFLGQFLKLAAEKKWGLLLSFTAFAVAGSLGWAGKEYVDTKHAEGVKEIKDHAEQIRKLNENQTQMVATMKIVENSLKAVAENMGDLKTTIRHVDETNRDVQKTVVDIYRDVYQIKLKQQSEGS